MPVKYPIFKLESILKAGSQIALGQKYGKTELEMSQIVNGRRELSEKEKILWSERLKRPVDELFKPIEEFD